MAKKNPITKCPFTAAVSTPSNKSSKGTFAVDGPAGPFGEFVAGYTDPSAPSTLLKSIAKKGK